jgi:hypothetical protein
MEWLGNVEPSLDDALSDPLILSVIAGSGRSPDDVRRLVAGLAQSVRAHIEPDRVHASGPGAPLAPHGPSDAPTSTNVISEACSADPSVSLPRKVLRLLRSALSHQ